jgi:hypothetical protein
MKKTGGGGLSANFANFREFFGRGILAADDADFRGWGIGTNTAETRKTRRKFPGDLITDVTDNTDMGRF